MKENAERHLRYAENAHSYNAGYKDIATAFVYYLLYIGDQLKVIAENKK